MATSSMGQGFNATTIQIINAYAALINGGNLMRPFLVSQVVDNQGFVVQENLPQVVRRVISEETSDALRTELLYAVTGGRDHAGQDFRGTGNPAYIPGFSVAGKTGTAQQGIRGGGEYIPTFVSFFPAEDPQFLILMTIDRPDASDGTPFAGRLVAPVVREFITDLIRIRNIQPADAIRANIPEIAGTPTTDWSGQRLADIAPTINNTVRSGFLVVGSGTVISHHSPPPGRPLPETAPIIFFMDPESRIDERMVTMPNVEGLTAEEANRLLLDIGLLAVLFTDRSAAALVDPQPVTSAAVPRDESEPRSSVPLPYSIHSQFPSAGTELEQGTQVMLRAN
jgi:stage V sporulation protein D (sporulation-specific penicillin-binding protein)